MHKTLIGLTAAAALAAGTVTVPSQANALPVWVVPAIIGAAAGGLILGAATSASAGTVVERRADVSYPYAYDYSYAPAYAAPTFRTTSFATVSSGCRIMRERVVGGWRTVQVCPWP